MLPSIPPVHYFNPLDVILIKYDQGLNLVIKVSDTVGDDNLTKLKIEILYRA